MKNKLFKAALAGLILSVNALTNIATAGLITTIDTGATTHVFESSANSSVGPISENGFTWSASNNGYYGYNGSWGLNDNGNWDNINQYIGLNSNLGAMTITFDSLVSEVLAFVSYASHASVGSIASISVYNLNGDILESFDLNSVHGATAIDQGWDYGFKRNTAEIKSIKFTNAYIVASNLRTFSDVSTTPVPEPTTLAAFALGLLGLASRRFKQS
jgi:hypothetical protein